MRLLRGLLDFLRDFLLGDDPLMFVIAWAAIGVTAAVVGTGLNWWWLLPLLVATALALSVLRARPPT
jgi:hypothetical protein